MYYHRGVQIRYRVVSLSLLVRPLVIEVTILSTLLLFESLHDSRPMLGAGSSSGVELIQVFMGKRLWQDGADQQVFHGLFITTFARCLSILIESPFLYRIQSLSGGDFGLTRWVMSHSNLEVVIPWD